MASKPRLILIDGHALAYRTYFALTRAGDPARWVTKAGEPTAGTYGFVSVLLRLIEQEKPEYLAVAFDVGKTFRDEIFPDYKATRQKMPDDLRVQITRIREIVAAFNIPVLEAEGYEADDVLGTIARKAATNNVHVIILTGDRDLLQLATENVSIRLAGRKLSEAKDYGPSEVLARYNIRPDQIVDYKAIVGDSSDNIPGIRGVGEKSAVKFLNAFQTLDQIYENLAEIPSRFRNKLVENKDSAYLSQKLAQIVTDVPIEFDLAGCEIRDINRERIAELFRQLEFTNLMQRVTQADNAPGQQMSMFAAEVKPARDFNTGAVIQDADALAQLAEKLNRAERIAFDVESTSTDPMQAELVGISLSTSADEGFYIPLAHQVEINDPPQLDIKLVIDALRPALTNPNIPKIGHNLKYDFLMLSRAGLACHPLSFDTMIAEWLCDPASRALGLKNLAWTRLHIEMTPIADLIGKGRNQITMDQVPISSAAPYAIADARVCLMLLPLLEAELKEKNLLGLFNELEMPLVPILAGMEHTGILLDTAFLADFSKKLTTRLIALEQQIHSLAGHPFNINSTQQLSRVLFEELGLKPPDRTRKTASGHYSTAAGVLEELIGQHAIIDPILKQRELSKIKSTYADSLPEAVNPLTGRVHTSFRQTGTVTGRLASANPNLQNIPIRSDIGREIRRAFIAAPGYTLLAVDYSQVELRVVAHMANDKAMISAFRNDADIHAATASAISGVPIDEIDTNLRRQAKAVNFGLIYGMSAFGLSRSTDLTLAEAENFVKRYFEQFPGVKQYLEDVRINVRRLGYVETLLGRRRYFPQLLPTSTAISEAYRNRALREAINAPVQGTAADILKLAMLKLPTVLQQSKLGARILLQVHDELVLECPQETLHEVAGLVQQVMQDAYPLVVPLKTDVKSGPNWAELKPFQV